MRACLLSLVVYILYMHLIISLVAEARMVELCSCMVCGACLQVLVVMVTVMA